MQIVYLYNKTPSDLLMLFQILFSFITTLSGLQPTSFINIQRFLATYPSGSSGSSTSFVIFAPKRLIIFFLMRNAIVSDHEYRPKQVLTMNDKPFLGEIPKRSKNFFLSWTNVYKHYITLQTLQQDEI
jgi:hypothetical protein